MQKSAFSPILGLVLIVHAVLCVQETQQQLGALQRRTTELFQPGHYQEAEPLGQRSLELAERLLNLGDAELAITPFPIGIRIEQLVNGAEQAEHLATEHG